MRFKRLGKSAQIRPPERPSRLRTLLLLSVLISSLGVWAALESGRKTDSRMRRDLARQARNIAETISPADVRALSFTAEDIDRPEFQRLSAQLRVYAETAGLRSLYTMALRKGKIVFGPESLKPGDPYASSPGTVYQTPTGKDFEIFQTGEDIVQGPNTDEYGLFVTASAPVIDPLTDKVLLVVGLDVEASVWQATIRKAQWPPLVTALVPCCILLAGFVVERVRTRLAPGRHEYLRHTEAATCATIMLLLTLSATLLIHDAEKQARADFFRKTAQTLSHLFTEEFHDIHTHLDTLIQFFESSENITRDEFRSYCTPILEHLPIQTCLWLPNVPVADAASFEEKAREENLPDFSIRQFNEQGSPLPAQGEILYPALYIEPLSGHEKQLGRDLYSEPTCRTAIDTAVRTGRITATEPINLSGQPDALPGVFILKQVAATQQKGVAGFFLQPETMLKNRVHHVANGMSAVAINFFQLHAGEEPRWMACSIESCRRDCWKDLQSDLNINIPVSAFGNIYNLTIAAKPHWLKEHPLRDWKMAMVIGLVLTLLLTTLIAMLASRPALLEKQIRQHAKELHDSEERFRIARSAANIGVWDFDIVNNQLIWDEQMSQIYGIRPEVFGGTSEAWKEYIHPDDRNSAEQAVNEAERGEKDFDTEFRIVRPDGEVRHVKASGKVLRDKAGKPVRMTGISYDVTHSRQFEETLRIRNEELERFNAAATGRELRMMELKKEINRLHRQLGQSAPYRITDAEEQNPSVSGTGLKALLRKLFGKGLF